MRAALIYADNKERNARILELRRAGAFPTDIAKTLGLTRNAVIGVCNRAGIVLDDNRASMIAHAQRGEDNSCSKLTLAAVKYIRENYAPYDPQHGCTPLARMFAVHRATIHSVVARKIWRHVA